MHQVLSATIPLIMSAEAINPWKDREYMPKMGTLYTEHEFVEQLLVMAACDINLQDFVDYHFNLLEINGMASTNRVSWRQTSQGPLPFYVRL